MSTSFDGQQGLVVVRTQVAGPSGIAVVRRALGTGATRTLINASLLVAVGYDPAATLERTEVTTGSGVEFAALVSLSKIVALGQQRTDFPVLAHTLPPSAGVDGVLGLDFLRGHVLWIDFPHGRLTLSKRADKIRGAVFRRFRTDIDGSSSNRLMPQPWTKSCRFWKSEQATTRYSLA